jgi:hypothetical protein
VWRTGLDPAFRRTERRRWTAQVADEEGDAAGGDRCDIGVEEDVLGARYCDNLRVVAGCPQRRTPSRE